MASTSANKQPLLVDRPLHAVFNVDKAITGNPAPGQTNASVDILGTNTAIPVVNAIGTDGAIIEDVYTIARGTTARNINLYFSSAADFLRTDALFIGSLASSTTIGTVVHWGNMPYTLAPVPQVGSNRFNQALYVPAGTCLWAGRQNTTNITDGPIIGFSGGWY